MNAALKRCAIVAAAVLLATIVADLLVYQPVKFGPEDLPGFYSLFAFIGGGIIVLAAALLPWLLRDKS